MTKTKPHPKTLEEQLHTLSQMRLYITDLMDTGQVQEATTQFQNYLYISKQYWRTQQNGKK